MTGDGMETYLIIAELAEHIKLSEQTVRRHVFKRDNNVVWKLPFLNNNRSEKKGRSSGV
jgi:hypothetical protein